MGHNRDYKPEDIAFPNQAITESKLVDEMEKVISSTQCPLSSDARFRTFATA